MPCYQINTVTLAFKAKNKDLIMEVLKQMDVNPVEISRGNEVKKISTTIGTFDLEAGTVETQDWNADRVNQFRVNYSHAVLYKAAAAKKWTVKRRTKRQYVVKKW